jgi:cation:H+ antiporter
MDIQTIILFAIGLVLLIVGAEWLVRGASQLAAAAGVSSLVIGLTVVAFGTSAPELAVSVSSAATGKADIALGNVIGSNIFNVLFILGISAAITPLRVNQQLIKLDVPIMIVMSILVYVFALNGILDRWEGGFFFAGIIAYTTFLVRQSRREQASVAAEYEKEFGQMTLKGPWKAVTLVLIGLVMLVIGSNWLVDGAVVLARYFGVSELIIGLTVVACGTSLPEVATSIVAAIRGERDIAVGNVVGSNIFNILSVLGLSSLIRPITVAPAAMLFDIPVMIAIAVACLPIFFTNYTISRWNGWTFLLYYVAYTTFLILDSTHHDALPEYKLFMLEFVIPITTVTILVLAVRYFRQRPSRK